MRLLEVQKQPESDIESFNKDTSNSQCGPEHAGLIAKQTVARGADLYVQDFQDTGDIPASLLSLLVTISWCGERMGRWPQAKDTKTSIGLRTDFSKAVDKYGAVMVSKAIDIVVKNLPCWDQRIISLQADEVKSEATRIRLITITSSPLFAEFHKQFSHISPDQFDKCYNLHNRNFVETALSLLRKEFKNVPPKELEQVEGWGQRWQQYLPRYLKTWRDDLVKMESRMRVAQKAWKESTS